MGSGRNRKDMSAVNARSLEVRRARAAIKTGLRAGTLTLQAALEDAVVADLPLVEVLCWMRGERTRSTGLENVGRDALRVNVNLMMSCGRASVFSRAWVAEQGARARWVPDA
jgi:hypothetical protein